MWMCQCGSLEGQAEDQNAPRFGPEWCNGEVNS